MEEDWPANAATQKDPEPSAFTGHARSPQAFALDWVLLETETDLGSLIQCRPEPEFRRREPKRKRLQRFHPSWAAVQSFCVRAL